MWIADTSFSIKTLTMAMDNNANINYLNRSTFYEEFQEVNPGRWMLTKDKMEAEFSALKNSSGIIGRKTSIYRDFNFDALSIDSALKLKDNITVNEGVMKQDSVFWNAERPEGLSANENEIYTMVDSIKKCPYSMLF